MNALTTTFFSMLLVTMTPFAFAQDGAKVKTTSQVEEVEEEGCEVPDDSMELKVPDWMFHCGHESALDMRARQDGPGATKIEVQGTGGALGDIVIVICGVDDGQLKPIGVMDAAELAADSIPLDPADFAALKLAFFAVKVVKETGDVEFGKVKTARMLVEEQDPID